jgi:hypothetical protein
MTIVAIEVDGSCPLGEVKYRCCDNRVKPSLKCNYSTCKTKDAVDKCPHLGLYQNIFNSFGNIK